MRDSFRIVLSVLIALAGLFALSLPVEAHALVTFSDPSDGASLTQPPTLLTITFTEAPDPKLSRVQLLDEQGQLLPVGPLSPVHGNPLSVFVPLPHLGDGVYTVSWRTVSSDDGHVASGTFAFGIGVQAVPPAPVVTVPSAPPPSALGVGGHWALDAAYGLLVGAAWVGLLAFAEISIGLLLLAGIGSVVGIVGVVLLAEAGRENASVDWATFLGTAFAHSLEILMVPIIAAGIAVAAAWFLQGRARRVALALTAVLGALAMLANAASSHAGSSNLPWLMVPAQWLHLASFAVWIGGLTAVLVGIRGLPSGDKAAAVGRFSVVAGYAFGALALSGVIRGLDDLNGWSSLLTTGFGQLLLAKTALFVVITPLAATNRWRYVRLGLSGIRPLRWVAGGEVALAGVIMVAAAFLTTVPPPSFLRPIAAARPSHEIVVHGTDADRSIGVRLEVIPGYVGLNRFTATVTDARSGRPIGKLRVFLLFDLPARPDLGESVLELKPVSGGIYSAAGGRVALEGTWTVTAVVESATNSYDVTLTVRAFRPPTE